MEKRRRMFMEAPDELDESWTHGALIGGMVSCGTDYMVARQYWESADALVDLGLRDQEMWRYAEPACFLYRHAVELFIKSILPQPKKGHAIGPLVVELEEYMTSKGIGLPQAVKDALLEFDTFDPRGTAFRYSDQAFHDFPGEHWIDVVHMKRTMGPILAGLEKLAGGSPIIG
jgi:HEPN domain-containing protein